ncbi:MAG: hypothetical protein L0271_08715, partial [Gemmatimonadetes bacterium]|nr:hypothetical protein [Gemmatimonadota bacterium]
MGRVRDLLLRVLLCLAVMALAAAPPAPAFAAQPSPLEEVADRPIGEIRFEGLQRVARQKLLNNIRSAVGDPLDPETVRQDVNLLSRLGEFSSIDALAELRDDGSVALIYRVVEQPIISEVQVVGNKVISDQDLLGALPLFRRGPRDDFLIQSSVRIIRQMYRDRGHYLTTVEIDESELAETGVLLLRVIEGPRVRVKAIEFSGNERFGFKQLRAQVTTRSAIPLFRRGELNEERI